jgi:phosphoribosyl 1,2-cyclic phosphodiesterase
VVRAGRIDGGGRVVAVTVLGSGSSGNAVLVETGRAAVLVDAGIPPRTVRRRFRSVHGRVPQRLDGVIVTHAHGDHARHAEALARSFGAPLYATAGVRAAWSLDRVPGIIEFDADRPFAVGRLAVSPFPVPHDAPQVSLVLDDGETRVGLATDLGVVPTGLAEHLSGCTVVLLESNHDPGLLAAGPYPPFLKSRIASALGHLSNEQAADLLRALDPCCVDVVLMHLSETNNRPELALRAARSALGGRRVGVHVARQREPLSVAIRAKGQLGLAFT